MRPSLRFGVSLAFLVLLLPAAAVANFAGLDVNANFTCDSTDMLQVAAPGDVGSTKSIDVYFDGLGGPIYGYGCVFCVTDKTKVSNPTFAFSTPTTPTPWLNQFFTSAGAVFPVTLSDWVTARYPDYLCFLIQGVDFGGATPINTYPSKLGTLQYQVAAEGCIQWAFDNVNVAALSQGTSVVFDSLGETCDTVSCPTAGEPLTVDAVTPACPIPDATKGVPYPAGTIFTATGGTLPYTWSQAGLPEGMNINSSTGQIAGTPTQAGTFPFVVTVNDGASGQAERNCSIFAIEYGVDVALTSADTVFTAQVDTVVHSFTVTNTGNTSGTFVLSASSDHGYTVEIFGAPNPVVLTGGNSATVQVRHIIPVVACPAHGPYAWDRAHLSATRQGTPAVTDADSATVGIAIEFGTNLSYANDGQCITPGQAATDYFVLENTGDCPDTFDLSVSISLPSWSASIVGNPWIFLAPGNPESIAVSVSVPSAALCTEVAQIRMDVSGRNFGGVNTTSGPECAATVLDGTLSDESNQVGAPGDTLEYCFTVTNTGNCAALFQAALGSSWPVDYPGGAFLLQVGQSAPICVGHLIPGSAQDGEQDELCVVLEASGETGTKNGTVIVDTSCVTTTVGVPCESTVEVVHTGDHPFCADPGSTNEDWFQVENTGNCADSFDLAPLVSPAGWTALVFGPTTIFLNPDDLVQVRVDLSVPASALCTDEGALSLRAEGRTYGATGQGASGTWCVNAVISGTLSDEGNQSGAPGDTVEYSFTMTNTGNCAALFGVAFGSSWANVHGSAEAILDPGDTAIVGAGHVVPKNASEGDEDELCAILSVLPDEARQPVPLDSSCVVTTTIVPCEGGVDVTGDTFLHGVPGESLYADFMVQNLGNGPDRFLLSVSSAAGWAVSVVGSDTTPVLNPGAADNVEVLVVVPPDALCGATGHAQLGALSLCDPAAWDTQTVAIQVDPLCDVSVVARTEDTTGVPGQGMDYIFRVTNEGNCEAVFGLSVSQSVDWDTSFGSTLATIPQGGHYDFPFHLNISPNAQPGDEHKVIVCAGCKIITKDDRPLGVCDSTITRVPTGCEADQPVLSLGSYQTVSYGGPGGLWTVRVQMKNSGPGKAVNVTAQMHHDLAWLLLVDGLCSYPDLNPGESSYGIDQFTFDLQNYPGGSFNVWFDVTYADTCGTAYQVRLDPTFDKPGENGLPLPASARLVLHQNVPNPFNPETSISFEMQKGAFAELVIYNTAGQNVKTLWSGSLPAGLHTFLWNGESERGTSVPSGTYFYSVRSEGLSDTKRMVLVR